MEQTEGETVAQFVIATRSERMGLQTRQTITFATKLFIGASPTDYDEKRRDLALQNCHV